MGRILIIFKMNEDIKIIKSVKLIMERLRSSYYYLLEKAMIALGTKKKKKKKKQIISKYLIIRSGSGIRDIILGLINVRNTYKLQLNRFQEIL